MYDQHIILDFEMNPVLKKYAEVRKHLHRRNYRDRCYEGEP